MTTTDRRGGLALIVTAGILTLMAALATAMAHVAIAFRSRTDVATDRIEARLLARSGLSYASARLAQDQTPRFPATLENQADDWTFRDGEEVPVENARNPSYGRTEPYTDADRNGRYDFGFDPVVDLDGNGRFDSWSGRLRGRHGPFGGTFHLKITAEGPKIDINGGTLDATDGAPQTATPDDRREQGRVPNGIPDCRDLEHSPPPPYPQEPNPYDPKPSTYPPSEPWLRNDRIAYLFGQTFRGNPTAASRAIRNRPAKGFRSLEEIRRLFSPGEWELAKSRLATTTASRAVTWGRFANWTCAGHPVQAIPLDGASRTLLAMLLEGRHRSGTLYISGAEGERVADLLIARRPFASRYELFKALDDNKLLLIQGRLPTDVNQMINMIAEAAEGKRSLFCVTAREFRTDFPLMSWISYDLPRVLPPPVGGDPRLERISWGSYEQDQSAQQQTSLMPLPLSLDPHAFSASVESLGCAGSETGAPSAREAVRGAIQPSAVVQARSQADFENLEEVRTPMTWSPSSTANSFRYQLRFAGTSSREDGVELRGRCVKKRTQTYPNYPLDSCPDFDASFAPPGSPPTHPISSTYYFDSNNWIRGSCYRGDFGKVSLMHCTGRRYGGEAFYQPCWEAGQPLRDPPVPVSAASNFEDVVHPPPPAPGSPSFAAELLCRHPGTPAGCSHRWAKGTFPWFVAGAFRGGTFDFWGLHVNWFQQTGFYESQHYSATGQAQGQGYRFWVEIGTGPYWVGQEATLPMESLKHRSRLTLHMNDFTASSLGNYRQLAYHRVSAVMIGQGVRAISTVYVDGIPDPGLTWAFEVLPINPTSYVGGEDITLWPTDVAGSNPELLGFGPRLLAGQWTQGQAMAVALDPAFWTSDAHPDVQGIPSYTSPLHVFPGRVTLTGASWDGFVPNLIRDATDAWNRDHPGDLKTPLRVEILAYPDERGLEEDEKVFPLPKEQWRTGGGHTLLEPLGNALNGAQSPRFRAFRFRVWLDASAVEGFNNETPVFDSIRVAYRSGRISSLEER